MKIATWNVERLKHLREQKAIRQHCSDADANILVLTETDKRLDLGNIGLYETEQLPSRSEIVPGKTVEYRDSERRVVIYSKYTGVRSIDTYDSKSAIAIKFETPKGNVIVYGVIIGLLGNRSSDYSKDIEHIVEDITRISKQAPMIVCGDFNCSFSDSYYYTKQGRVILQELFDECEMSILTADCNECIDHIVVSNILLEDASIDIREWNQDKKLSDHKGVMVTIKESRRSAE